MQEQVGPFTAVVPVPSAARAQRVKGIADAVGEALGAGVLEVLSSADEPFPAAGNSLQQVRHLQSRLTAGRIHPDRTGRILLVADVAASRWTLTMAAVLLREAGAGEVHGLVAHQRPG